MDPVSNGSGTPAGFDDLLTANEQYAEQYRSSDLAGKAARGLAVVTCMDSRIDPLQMLGLDIGDAKVLRNAGARVSDDVLRNLILAAHLLDVTRVMVVAHTDCRMSKVDDEQVHRAIGESSGIDTRSLEFHTIEDQREALAHDVRKIRSSPFLPRLQVVGCVYDVKTGRLQVAVPDA